MKIYKRLPSLINKNLTPQQAIMFGFVFNFFCYFIMILRAVNGSAKKDWGYSEFLLNYSEGFIRRGLPGTVLQTINKFFGLDPYLFLTAVLSITLLLILLIFYYLLNSTKVTASTIIFLSSNPLLLNAPFLSVTMFRKDWLIILGLMVHAYFARLVLFEKISTVKYIMFLFFLIIYSQLAILSHEITFLFVFVHFFLIRNIRQCFSNFELKFIKKLYIFFFVIQLGTFLYLIMNHGASDQAEKIAQSVSTYTEIGSINAILSFGSSSSQVLSGGLNLANFLDNSLNYSIWFFIGPYLIFRVLKPKHMRTLLVPLLSTLPVLTLFILIGGDWGRWLTLLCFTFFIILVSDWQFINIYSNSNLYSLNLLKPLFKSKSLIVVLSIYFVSLLFRAPVGNPTSIGDIGSGVFEIIYRYISSL